MQSVLALPSIGEALGVLAGYTLLASSETAPFIHYWNYTPTILDEPGLVNFSATLSYKDYASGGDQEWKGIFYIVLFTVVLFNVLCGQYLFWHFWHHGEVTDYTEPQNLFALAINSPPSQMLAGVCGGGPSGEMLGKKWRIDMSRPTSSVLSLHDHNSHNHDNSTTNRQSTGITHPHFFVRYPEENEREQKEHSTLTPSANTFSTKHKSLVSKLEDMQRRSKVPRPKSIQNLVVDESPAVAQYNNLIGKR